MVISMSSAIMSIWDASSALLTPGSVILGHVFLCVLSFQICQVEIKGVPHHRMTMRDMGLKTQKALRMLYALGVEIGGW